MHMTKKYTSSVPQTGDCLVKRRKIMKQGRSADILTDDVLVEIFSRLPVDTLARLRYVCKRWLTIISTDPLLPELHLSRCFESDRPKIIINSFFYDLKINSYRNNSLILIDVKGGHTQNILRIKTASYDISPCCNGLMCVYSRSCVTVFNPTTKQELILPKPTKAGCSYCFLGYLPTTKQYKVTRFFGVYPGRMQSEVLTIGTRSWRQNTTMSDLDGCIGGVTMNGFIYWIGGLSDSPGEFGIMSFDLNQEKFKRIKFPVPLSWESYVTIKELEGRVSVVIDHKPESMTDIWMLECTATNTWIKRYNLKFRIAEPILINQGRILLKSAIDLHYCDLTGQSSELVYAHTYLGDTYIWNESLLSLQVGMHGSKPTLFSSLSEEEE